MSHDNINNIILDTADSVRQLCCPLQHLGIAGFFYIKIFNDGTFIDLTTDPDWASQFFNKFFAGQYDVNVIKDHMFVFEDISLWELNQHNTIWQEAKSLFGYGNGISITKRSKYYNEKYCFYTSIENKQINEFYLNNIHLLKQFIGYFNEKTVKIMQKAQSNKLIIPRIYIEKDISDDPCGSRNVKEFIKELEGVYIDGGESFARLSKREMDILKWLVLGKSAKEIGAILTISSRTVEQHINNLKIKLKCFKTSQLTNIAMKYQLDEFFRDL